MLGDVSPRDVRTSPAEPVIYRGRDNIVVAEFQQFNGTKFVALDFSAVTRVVLALTRTQGQADYVFDSQITAGVIDWLQGGGLMQFDVTQYALTAGYYDARLVVYDTQHTEGQVVVDGQDSARLLFEVREIFSAGNPPPVIPSGGDSAIRQAGETISALKVVYELDGQVFVLDQADAAHVDLLLGVAITSGNAGDTIIVQRAGTLDDAGWAWTADPVYLGSAGAITQVPPTTGFRVRLGASPMPTRINLEISEPIDLG